jgi:hypothetical protein
MAFQTLTSSQASPEVPINENFVSAAVAALFGIRQVATTGLTWGFHGGQVNGNTVADAVVTLAASTTNYVVATRAAGIVSTSTATTNWNDTITYVRLYSVVTGASSITSYVDYRQGYGVQAQGLPLISDSTARAIVLADAGTVLLHPSADTTARTWTIPANASVVFPVGTVLRFVNQNTAGVLTIAITTDTMRLAPGGTTGSRTLAANGVAEAIKVTSTEWIISGVGLT